jgi:hypothetical protein
MGEVDRFCASAGVLAAAKQVVLVMLAAARAALRSCVTRATANCCDRNSQNRSNGAVCVSVPVP